VLPSIPRQNPKSSMTLPFEIPPFLEFVHFNRYLFANVYGVSVFVVTRHPSLAAAKSRATSGTIPSGYKLLTGWFATQHWSDARYRGSEDGSFQAWLTGEDGTSLFIFANLFFHMRGSAAKKRFHAATVTGATSWTIVACFGLNAWWLATQYWFDARYRGSEAWSSEARSSEAWGSEAWSSEAWGSEGALNQEGARANQSQE